ncbi:MAG: Hsp20/alpha crystallin family protein [Chloroflexi bacterium]|nr:Hsp20/alpha crystallin family protein [Chloroflexota bacterium]
MEMSSGNWLGSMQSMQKEMERLLNYFGSSKPPSGRFARLWEPAVDVYETATHIVVMAELPGVKRKDIDLVVDSTSLIIRGEKTESSQGEKRSYSQMEIHTGPFERRILLPARIDPDKTEATHEDGILEVALAKVRQERTRRVEIDIRD